MRFLLAFFLVAPAFANNVDAPNYIRQIKNERDVSAINENSRALSDAIRKTDLTGGGTVGGALSVQGGVSGASMGVSGDASVGGKTSLSSASISGSLNIGGQANIWVFKASADYVNAYPQDTMVGFTLSNYLFPGEINASSITWRMEYSCSYSSAGAFIVHILNGDVADSYDYYAGGPQSTAYTNIDAVSYNCIQPNTISNVSYAAKTNATSIFVFESYYSTTTTTGFTENGNMSSYTSYESPFNAGGRHRGGVVTSIALDSTTVTCSGAANHKMPLTCHIELWRKGSQHR